MDIEIDKAIVGVADNIDRLLRYSMDNWRTELTADRTILCKVSIRRRMFQGDSISPLLFVIASINAYFEAAQRRISTGRRTVGHRKINHLLFVDDLKLYGKNERETESLVDTVRFFSEDSGMQFGNKNCATIRLLYYIDAR